MVAPRHGDEAVRIIHFSGHDGPNEDALAGALVKIVYIRPHTRRG